MNYEQELTEAVEAVKREGRYRIFADVKRRRGAFPKADVLKGNAANTITVWCSNDYLGMGQHPKVLAAMHEAIDLVGAGSGGTRNIAGTRWLNSSASLPASMARRGRCSLPRHSLPTKLPSRRWHSYFPAASSFRTRRITHR